MLLFWNEGIPYWTVGLAYGFVGIGIGLAGTPASRSLTASVPVIKAGMASGTADLQRDLGGAIFNSLFGALLAAGYAAAVTAAIAASPNAAQVTPQMASEMTMSFAGAQSLAAQYPQYASQIMRQPNNLSWLATNRPTSPASLQYCSARRWCSSCSPGWMPSARC